MTEELTWDGGWEAHRQAELEAWSRTTPEQRLAWLEAAIEFARRAAGLASPREPTG